MTRRPDTERPSRTRVGGSVRQPVLAPALAAAGLIIATVLTVGLFTGNVPFAGGTGGDPNGGGLGPDVTPAPSDVVIAEPEKVVPGSFLYVKQGSIWVQQGNETRRLTTTGKDSMPSWSPDGEWVYFIRTEKGRGYFPSQGRAVYYTMLYPNLMRIRADGSGEPELLHSGRYKSGKYTWFYWLRQPVLAPDLRTIALVSDAPDPTESDVVLQTFDLETGELASLGLKENPPLGHQDPAWRHDGKILLYVRNGRDGTRGAPVIWRYFPESGKTTTLTGPGYLSPAWAPNGKYVAATKTSTLGTDIVILDAKDGTEVLRVTRDGSSWSPVWSPAGDGIAFLRMSGGIVDLKLIELQGSEGGWTLGETIDLTTVSGLDGGSRPGWYIPADQIPRPTPGPSPTAAPESPAASPAG
jgi:Tol biopolymer transport system component